MCPGPQISESLQGNAALEALDIGGNNIDENGIKALSEALRGNGTLKTLELGYNPIGEKGAAQLSSALKYDTQVGAGLRVRRARGASHVHGVSPKP